MSPGPPRDLGLTAAAPPDGRGERRRARHWEQLLADLDSASSELSGTLRGLGAEQGRVPSLCAGWSVRDVVLHLVVGDELAQGALRGEPVFPEPTDDELALRDLGVRLVREKGDVALRQAAHLFEKTRARFLALAAALPADRLAGQVQWAATPISCLALVQSRFMETWIHGWDLRRPLGIPQPFDDRVWWVTDLAVRTLPYALAKEGVEPPCGTVRVRLDGPGGGGWERRIGEGDRPVAVTGPTWAWLLLAGRRDLDRGVAFDALTADPRDAGRVVLESARAFA